MHQKRKIKLLFTGFTILVLSACQNKITLNNNYKNLYAKTNKTFEYTDINPPKGYFKIDTGIYFGRLEKMCILHTGMNKLDSIVHFLNLNKTINIQIEINNYGISQMYSRNYFCQGLFIEDYLAGKKISRDRFIVIQNLGHKPIISQAEVKNYSLEKQQKWLSLNNRLDLTIM